MFGGRDRIAERRVHDDDAARRRRRNVDIVDADPGATDDTELLRRRDHLLADLGGRADGKAVVVADGLEELLLVLAEIGQVIDRYPAILEDLHGGLGQLVGDENAGGGHFGSSGCLSLRPKRSQEPERRMW